MNIKLIIRMLSWQLCALLFSAAPLQAAISSIHIPYIPPDQDYSFKDVINKIYIDGNLISGGSCAPVINLYNGIYPTNGEEILFLRKIYENRHKIIGASSKTDLQALINPLKGSIKCNWNKNKNITSTAVNSISDSTIANIAGVDFSTLQSAIIAGFGDFIVSRARGEAALYFQDELYRTICKVEELAPYFANTCATISGFNGGFSLSAMGEMLKAAAQRDLEALPDTALAKTSSDLKLMEKCFENGENCSEAKQILAIRFFKRFHPQAYQEMDNLVDNPDNKNKEIQNCFFGNSDTCEQEDKREAIKNKINETIKPKSNSGEALFAFRLGYRIFLETKEGRSMNELLRGLSEMPKLECETNSECTKAATAVRQAGAIYRAVQLYHHQLSNEPKAADYLGVIFQAEEAACKSFDVCNGMNNLLTENNIEKLADLIINYKTRYDALDKSIKQYNEEVIKFMESAEEARTMGELVRWQISIVESSLTFLEEIFQGDLIPKEANDNLEVSLNLLKKSADAGDKLIEKDYAGLLISMYDIGEYLRIHYNIHFTMPQQLQSFMGVAAQLASAKNSEEVAKVIEAAAMPVGSYRIKQRQSAITITALYGVGGILQNMGTSFNAPKAGPGVSAPVGIHFSTNIKKSNFLQNHYVGAFVSIIDMGPVVLTPVESGVEHSSFTFEQIFSPGVYATLQIHGPLNMILGYSFTPKILRETNADGSSQDIDATRAYLGLNMDLTLYNMR